MFHVKQNRCVYCRTPLDPDIDSASCCVSCTIRLSQPEPVPEFDCSECGRHIVVICGPVNEYRLCAACMMLPGWHDIPELRRRLDPDGEKDCQ